ncbi:MAG TPA: hypothetical protein VGR35_00055 [Tepidisphaeraceae bacterium]|nr:hypothetical protein [Tepidisphaeraceae bacterium]
MGSTPNPAKKLQRRLLEFWARHGTARKPSDSVIYEFAYARFCQEIARKKEKIHAIDAGLINRLCAANGLMRRVNIEKLREAGGLPARPASGGGTGESQGDKMGGGVVNRQGRRAFESAIAL